MTFLHQFRAKNLFTNEIAQNYLLKKILNPKKFESININTVQNKFQTQGYIIFNKITK